MTPVGCYAAESRRDRVHVATRWRSCPFDAVAEAVPSTGRVLDLGTGHGVFALHLHQQDARRTLVGVDIDPHKIQVAARAATACGAPVSFVLGSAEAVPAGPWDAITILDVLYLLPEEAQRKLVTAAAGELAPGGCWWSRR